MRILFVLIIGFGIGRSSTAQVAYLSLKNELLDLEKQRYTIADFRDLRPDSTYVGVVKTGPFNVEKAAKLRGGNSKSIAQFLAFNFTYVGSDSFPVYVALSHLRLVEGNTGYGEYGQCELTLSFYLNHDYSGTPYYASSTVVSDTFQDVYATHINRLKRALTLVLNDFNATFSSRNAYVIERSDVTFDTADIPPVRVVDEHAVARKKEENAIAQRDSTRAYLNAKRGGRNVVSLGYQIGGWTLVGVHFEYRITDLLGVHFGGGITGLTAGINLHTSPSKNSLYVSPNFKDGGFGLLGSFCLEIGGRIPFTKKSYDGFGLQLQGGLQRVVYIDDTFKQRQQDLLGDSFSVGTIALSMGIGLSF